MKTKFNLDKFPSSFKKNMSFKKNKSMHLSHLKSGAFFHNEKEIVLIFLG